jgi:hypothetical protein
MNTSSTKPDPTGQGKGRRIRTSAGLWLAVLLTLVSGSGASCPGFISTYPSNMPRVLPTTATLEDVITVVNTNSGRIQSLHAEGAEIYVPGAPSASADILLERPQRFRLRAETRLTGPEVDLGSNDELFWFWVKQSPQPALYYCAHKDFARSAARQILPVEPEWLIDAFGITTLDPNGEHSTPMPVGQGRLRIETRLPRPEGELKRAIIVDDARGWILEQHLYDAGGKPIASAILSGHRMDPLSQAILPKQVKIIWPISRMEMTIELKEVTVNNLTGDPRLMWAMPTYSGFNPVDLADPHLRLSTQPEPAPNNYDETGAPKVSRKPEWMNKLKLF